MSQSLQDDLRYCWHPMTQHQREPDPPVILCAKGASLFDENGREILDMISSWWTCVHGHGHPALNAALVKQSQQLNHVMFAGFTHPPAIDLSKKLAAHLPGDLNRVFFSDNGSSANEIALKIAYQYWRNKGQPQKTKFLAFEGGYHGETVGAMSVGKGCDFFKDFEGLMFSVDLLPYAHSWEGDTERETKEQAALSQIESVISAQKNHIAALIIEPLMQGAGGIRLSSPDFIKAVTELAQSNNILVIYDEVAVGFGRTGSLFACQKSGTVPDLVCLSKGLTGGYLPLAVTVAQDEIYEAFLSDDVTKAFLHSHTFTANPLACAVAAASLEIFEEGSVFDRLREIENLHKNSLGSISSRHKIYKPRVMGPVMAFNLSDGQSVFKNDKSEWLRQWFFYHGLNIRPIGDVVYLLPPYCITDEELSRAYQGIEEGLTALSALTSLAA